MNIKSKFILTLAIAAASGSANAITFNASPLTIDDSQYYTGGGASANGVVISQFTNSSLFEVAALDPTSAAGGNFATTTVIELTGVTPVSGFDSNIGTGNQQYDVFVALNGTGTYTLGGAGGTTTYTYNNLTSQLAVLFDANAATLNPSNPTGSAFANIEHNLQLATNYAAVLANATSTAALGSTEFNYASGTGAIAGTTQLSVVANGDLTSANGSGASLTSNSFAYQIETPMALTAAGKNFIVAPTNLNIAFSSGNLGSSTALFNGVSGITTVNAEGDVSLGIIPEPHILLLLGSGLLAIGALRKKATQA